METGSFIGDDGGLIFGYRKPTSVEDLWCTLSYKESRFAGHMSSLINQLPSL